MQSANRQCLVYIGDIHFREKRPRRRIDDPVEAITKKIQYIIRRAIKLDAVAIVLGGDLGHSTVWSTALAGAVKRAFSPWQSHCDDDVAFSLAIKEEPSLHHREILTIIGNHDVPSYNYDHMENTGIQACVDNGTVKILEDVFTIGNFQIWPFHAGNPETNDLVAGKWQPPAEVGLEVYKTGGEAIQLFNPKKLHVAIVHAPVGPEANPHQIDYRTLQIPFFDVAMFADIHDGFPIRIVIPGCTIANPGSICRWNILDADREIQFAVIYDDGEVVYEPVPSTPKDLAFDLTGVTQEEVAEAKAATTRGYLAAVSAVALNRDQMEHRDFVRTVGREAGFDEASISTLLEELPT